MRVRRSPGSMSAWMSSESEVDRINDESSGRMAKTGEVGFEVTAALAGFESPARRP